MELQQSFERKWITEYFDNGLIVSALSKPKMSNIVFLNVIICRVSLSFKMVVGFWMFVGQKQQYEEVTIATCDEH